MSGPGRKARIEALQSRLDWVVNELIPRNRPQKSKALSYLLAEADALRWAIGELSERK